MNTWAPSLIAPLWGAKYRVNNSRLTAPRPTDEPRAHAPGLDPDRVLIVGNGIAVGWGVTSHDLALPGQLARALSARTGRGSDVDVVADPTATCESIPALLRSRQIRSYDTIIVTVGVSDALQLRSEKHWTRGISSLLDALRDVTSPLTEVLVMGIQPPSSIPAYRTRPGGLVDRHTLRLNTITRQLCRDRVRFLAPPVTAALPDEDRHRSPRKYQQWAQAIAAFLSPLLDRRRQDGATARRLRDLPQPQRDRVAALDRLGILDTPAEERFDVIVRRAQRIFGVEGAAFNLVAPDHQWSKALIGAFPTSVPIDESFCAHTIQTNAPLIIADAWKNASFPQHPAVRFYAGFPVEAPDGTRIGALCVFDSRPLAPDDHIDMSALRDLALAVQHQLGLGGGPAISADRR